jgi:hypothetical protein
MLFDQTPAPDPAHLNFEPILRERQHPRASVTSRFKIEVNEKAPPR